MRIFLIFLLACISLLQFSSCENDQQRNSLATTPPAPPPSGKEASRLETVSESVLAGMKGLNFTESEAIQEYADSIQRNTWGQVAAVLRKVNPVFEDSGDSMLTAEGEAVIFDQKIAATMVFDLKSNQVFAGQYNFKTFEILRWPAGDSLKIPAALSNWMIFYQLSYIPLEAQ